MKFESNLPHSPKEILCDNEAALTSIPHRDVKAHPANGSQHNGRVERLHRELRNLASLHNTTTITCKANETFSLEDGAHAITKLFTRHMTMRIDIYAEEKPVNEGAKKAGAKEAKKAAAAKSHVGRTLKGEGLLVLCKIPRMQRKKDDNPWSKPNGKIKV